jgi:transposase InsO family protein
MPSLRCLPAWHANLNHTPPPFEQYGSRVLPLSRQCELAEVPRATVYRRLTAKVPQDAAPEDLLLCRQIDEEDTCRPFYGSRRMVVFLRTAGHVVNRKRVQRLMRSMGLAGMAPVPNTSKAFTDVLKREGVDISMDGRGRALDNIFVERLWHNVKYEDVCLKGYANMAELMLGLAQYFAFCNVERPHQSLGYETPASVYHSGIGGGALIIDKYGVVEMAVLESA